MAWAVGGGIGVAGQGRRANWHWARGPARIPFRDETRRSVHVTTPSFNQTSVRHYAPGRQGSSSWVTGCTAGSDQVPDCYWKRSPSTRGDGRGHPLPRGRRRRGERRTRDDVLAHLTVKASSAEVRGGSGPPVVVAFLGDNIYDEGLPTAPSETDVEKLAGQVQGPAGPPQCPGRLPPRQS